jgi:hypothetical protein
MARFIGSSGCTAKLVEDLRDLGLAHVNTYAEILPLLDNSDAVIAKQRADEEQVQRTAADSARAEASNLQQSLDARIQELERQLACERDSLWIEIEHIASEISRQPFKAALRIPRWWKLRLRHRKLTRRLEVEARRPFAYEFAEIRRLRSAGAEIERELAARIEARLAPYRDAKAYLESNRGWVLGAKGEEMVLNALRALPDEYCVISDVVVDLGRSARWRARPGVLVRSAQIDHVVIGPGCVFLVETKNWSEQTAEQAAFSAEEQISRAAYIFYLLAQSHFGRRKLPRRDVVVHLNDRSARWRVCDPPNQYVTQVPVTALVAFIRAQRRQPAPGDVTAAETEAWLVGGASERSSTQPFYIEGGYYPFPPLFRFSGGARLMRRLWR